MSQRLSDRVTEVVEPIVADYGPQFSWDYRIQLMPTPQGIVAMGVFVLVMKNPLLGTGDMAAVEMVPDITAVLQESAAKEVVAKLVLQLRDLHAKNLEIPARP
jgi:hypothetical protein